MSKLDMSKIEFHAVVMIPRDEIKQAKFNIITAKQESQAASLGVLIAKTKGWRTQPVGEIHESKLDLYVFTRNELRDFIDTMVKQKLIEMSGRSSESDIKDRLILLSERV